MYKPQFSDNISLRMGSEAERRFDKIANRARAYPKVASQTDQRSHIDRYIDVNGKKYSVEIKSMKKISRSDPAPQDNLIWIELHGVHPSDRGWLYGGKADLIAFEMRYGFMFVDRKKLITLVDKSVDFKKIVSSPYDAKNKIYLRRKSSDFFSEGHDKVTLIDSSKIENVAFMRWRV